MLSERTGSTRLIVVALLAGAAVYLPSLSFRFTYDDLPQIRNNRWNLNWRSAPGYFTSDVWSYSSTKPQSNYYRPVFKLWLMLNYQMFGLAAPLWHLSAVAAHLAAMLLFYFLALRLARDALVAAAATLLFGVHPVHVEAVTWISGATETLFAAFGFAAILCHLKARDAPLPSRRIGWRIASLALFALGVLAKETALIVPLLIAAWEWLFPPSAEASSRRRLRGAFAAFAPFAIVAALYLFLRLRVLGAVSPVQAHWSAGTMFVTWPLTLAYYLRLLLLPSGYGIIYPVEPVANPGFQNYLLPLVLVGIVAAVLIWLARRSRIAAFSALLIVLPLLPVLHLRSFSPHDFIHDRYLYVPVAGLSLLLAMAWKQWCSQRARAAETALLAATILLAVLTVHTSFYWRNDRFLFEHAIRSAPDSPMAQLYWGKYLITENRCAESIPMIKSALLGFPESVILYNDIAYCYVQLGDFRQAVAYLHDAMLLAPADPAAFINLAKLELLQGRLDQAEVHVRQALRLRVRQSGAPDEVMYHLILGKILEKKGDLAGALGEYRSQLIDNPYSGEARDLASSLAARLGEPAR